MKRFTFVLFLVLFFVLPIGAQTEYRWAVDTVTNEFVYGGAAPYDVVPGLSPDQIRLVLTRPPDKINERYSGDPEDPFRAATQQEKDDVALIISTVAAQQFIQSREIRALIWEIIEAVAPPANATKFNNTINNLKETWRDQPWSE
jgi:predicted secreted protein